VSELLLDRNGFTAYGLNKVCEFYSKEEPWRYKRVFTTFPRQRLRDFFFYKKGKHCRKKGVM